MKNIELIQFFKWKYCPLKTLPMTQASMAGKLYAPICFYHLLIIIECQVSGGHIATQTEDYISESLWKLNMAI